MPAPLPDGAWSPPGASSGAGDSGDSGEIPRRLRVLEPIACLALAGHAVAVETVVNGPWIPVITASVVTLLGLGLAGLAGARSTLMVIVRAATVLVLGFLLQAIRVDSSGYFVLWLFVLVAVYPLVLPRRIAVLIPLATPLGYLALLPLHAVDGSVGIALLRALSLALVGVFVLTAAEAYRGVAAAHEAVRAQLDTFLAAAPVGLAYWDAGGRFQRINHAFAELTGRGVDEHLGRLAGEVPGMPDALAADVARVLADGRAVPDVDVARGEREWTAGFYPVRSSRGIAGVGAVLVEMTRERAGARRLARSERKAREALTTLQTALLPAEVTSQRGVDVVARYQAAGRHDLVGGDWYDTIPLPTGGLALVIGDVEGHDLTAASVMGLVRGAVRSYALEGHPPSIVLQRVGAFLLSAGIDRLVTMAFVQLYPGDAVATIALAGHPAPLVVTDDGGAFVLDTVCGPILGVAGLSRWEERTVQLPRDASLVLYTDGVGGHEELREIAGSLGGGDGADGGDGGGGADGGGSDPASRLVDALIGVAPGHDDAAILVARLRASPAPSLSRTFPAWPISAGIARTWLADLFDGWAGSEGPVSADHQETAQLLLTELVSNAVRHSDESFSVSVRLVGRRLRVAVGDSSERMPVMRRPEATMTEGRGLRLVDALSSAWGVEILEHGKAVWFELDLDSREVVDADRLLAAFADPLAEDLAATTDELAPP